MTTRNKLTTGLLAAFLALAGLACDAGDFAGDPLEEDPIMEDEGFGDEGFDEEWEEGS